MRKHALRRWSCRAVVAVLVPSQVLLSVPVSAETVSPEVQVSGLATPPPPPPEVTVNREVPQVSPAPAYPAFSTTPTDEEITRARVFGEPLLPVGASGAGEENQALAAAITAWLRGGDPEARGPFNAFLEQHPASAWRASLLANLGTVDERLGYFTRADRRLREAWTLARDGQDAASRAVADQAIGELLELHMQFGHVDELEELLQQLEGRVVLGVAGDIVGQARIAVAGLRNHHELAAPSGPIAVERILALVDPGEKRPAEISSFHPTPDGASIEQIETLARDVGLGMQPAQRSRGASIPLPAIVHLKAGHFAAVVREEGRYVVLDDPLLGGEVWLSRNALEEETTGYFLVPDGDLETGWQRPDASKLAGIRGKCAWVSGKKPPPCVPGQTNCGCNSQGGSSCSGAGCNKAMAGYTFNALLAGLVITDTPVGHQPAVGPGVHFTATYNQRGAAQPQSFSFSNLGSLWSSPWIAYIEDNPANLDAPADLYGGGGTEKYSGLSAGQYAPDPDSHAVLVRTSTAPIRYEHRHPDGSIAVFAQADATTSFPRRVFLTQAIDPQGNALTFTYDVQLRLVSVADALSQVTTLSYELFSDPLKVTKVTDPFGRWARLGYTEEGRLSSVTDTIGITSEFSYGQGDFINALTTPYGTTTFAQLVGYDPLGHTPWQWVEATDPLGAKERLEFWYIQAAIPLTEPASAVPTGFAPDNANLGTLATFYWDKRASMLYPGDYSKARTTKWLRTEVWWKVGPHIHSEKLPLENRVWYAYDGNPAVGWVGEMRQPSRIARVLDDGQSQIHRYEYNALGEVIRETDPPGRAIVYNYASNGIDLLEARQVNGQSTDLLWTATYNSQHKPLTFTDAAGQTTTLTYNTQGQVLTVVTPPRGGLTLAQRTTTYAYDTDGYLQSGTGPVAGATTSYTYDGYGRVRTVTDSDSYTRTDDYDALDRPTRTTYPDATYEETVYNRLDPEKHRDRLGRWSETFYDALRRPVAMRDPLARTTMQQWCNCGTLDKVIDANNNATTWERDLQGRVTREVRPDSSAWEYTYEITTSRLKQRKDPKNQLAGYEYFLDNNLKQVTYTNAVFTTPNVSFTYDAVYNRPTTMTDGTGTTTYTYNPVSTSPPLGAGELASVDGPFANDTVSYTYEELGRVASRGLSGFVSSFSYDALGRLSTQGSPVGNFAPSYDGTTFRPLSLSYPNGQTTQYTYFPNSGDHRLQQIKHLAPGGATISKYDYTYTLTENLATWSQQVGANPPKVYTLGYDPGDQLTTASVSGPSPLPVPSRFAYSFDPAGNRTAEQLDDTVTWASHDGRNRLTSRQPGGALLFRGTLNEAATVSIQATPGQVAADNTFAGPAQVPSGTSNVVVAATDPSGNTRTNIYQVTQAGSTTTYMNDAAGNLTGDGTRTFEWDAENQLTAVKQGAATLASFVYDGDGRRAQKTAGGVTTTYVYDGDGVIEERLSTGGTLKYVRGPRIDQHWAMRDGGGVVTYFLADHLGSVVQTTDVSGAVTLSRDYDPYGSLLSGASQSGYAFTGRDWDAETGLLYMRARYYDPNLGRFLSEDPIGLENFYVYVANRPTVGTDPYGLIDPWTLCFRFGICPPPGGSSATVMPPPPKPRPTPMPINCSGGPNAAMRAIRVPPPKPRPVCIGKGVCPCGYKPVPDFTSGGLFHHTRTRADRGHGSRRTRSPSDWNGRSSRDPNWHGGTPAHRRDRPGRSECRYCWHGRLGGPSRECQLLQERRNQVRAGVMLRCEACP